MYRFKETLFISVISLCFGMFGSLVVYHFTAEKLPKGIATINITGLVDGFIQDIAKQSLPPDEMNSKATEFGELLNKIVEDIAKRNQLILMPSEAVIAGGRDLTKEVQYKLKRDTK